ncbi:hypothetical protein [Pseudoalteromonas arabiensis]|uniref:hypothetical protein n=1 Tax=Pseudoalteromonas arabiensis TaxID=874454 RepID=UPI0007819A7F|nr:hypothetical protein [Pseudoalteromonas arabiensis]
MSNYSENKPPVFLLAGLIFIALLCVAGTYLLWEKGLGVGYGGTTETWAHFGSFFGGVLGPVLSFFSFVGVMFTIYLQSKSNKEQALANTHTAEAIKSSEQLAKENLKEQIKLHQVQIEYDKQQRLFDLLVNSFVELEQAGCDAAKELIPERNEPPWVGKYFNPYCWRIQATANQVKINKDKISDYNVEIIIMLLDKTIGQIDMIHGALEDRAKFVIENESVRQEFINSLIIEEKRCSEVLAYLKEKYNY